MAPNLRDPTLRLIKASPEWRRELRAYARDYRKRGENMHAEILEDFEGFLDDLSVAEDEESLPPGVVSYSVYWLLREDGRIVGRSTLRHRLNEALLHEGGHIGYDVRPGERLKGYGARMLGLILEKARERGLRRILVTCDSDNIGSARIIHHNGGVLDSEVVSRQTGKKVSRYWIDLGPQEA